MRAAVSVPEASAEQRFAVIGPDGAIVGEDYGPRLESALFAAHSIRNSFVVDLVSGTPMTTPKAGDGLGLWLEAHPLQRRRRRRVSAV